MLKEISKSDINVRSFQVYKEWTVDQNDILPVFGKHITSSLFDPETDEKSCGVYKRLVYQSVKTQFYHNPATASVLFEQGLRKSYASTDERVIGDDIAVIAIPQVQYGESIKIGSVSLTDGSKTYIDDSNSNLVYNNTIYGNVFYDKGIIVLTNEIVSGSTLSDYSLTYRSTKTIHENEVFIEVLPHEFNVSTNPSAYYEDGQSSYQMIVNNSNYKPYRDREFKGTYLKTFYTSGIRHIRNTQYPYTSSLDPTKFGSFDDYELSGSADMTGSYLAPFITTIGLYDNELNLVAVAKLPQPIKSLPDYPVNFIIRFDN